MPSTFARVNGVLVDPVFSQTSLGLYPDVSLQTGGGNAAAVVPVTGSTATYGQLWRGMPVAILQSTGMLVPPNSAGTIKFAGVLLQDLTQYELAKGNKISVATRGRVRSYAGGNITIGGPVKMDTSSNFSGFVAFVVGTDTPDLLAGYAYPIDDGSASNGASAATAMVQGDSIFVNLI